MDNFAGKLEAGNYVIEAEGFSKTTVSSSEQVIFSFSNEGYDDFALMTLDDETFQAVLTEDGVDEITYIATGNAVDSAGGNLPSSWISIAEGNMFNLFYNDPEDPLTFVSYDVNVKQTLLRLAGLGNVALNRTQEVYMVLDQEDPSSVHFTAVIEDDPVARLFFDDLDLTMQFGSAGSDPRIDAWMNSPVYPETRTAWSEDDLFYLNSVFLPGYGSDAVPFPEFASYALTIDESVFSERDALYMTDAHGTEEDLAGYIDTLLENGFTAADGTRPDGSTVTVYRRMLRADYRCYVSVYPHYDRGFILEAERYYDNPQYDSLEEINRVIGECGFEALEDDEQLSGWTATDIAAESTESWLYFFEYELALYASFRYTDEADPQAYLKAYGDRLEAAGYHAVYTPNGEDQERIEYYASADGSSTFRYYDSSVNTITLLFRNEKVFPAEEAGQIIRDAGFPEVSFHGDFSCRDLSMYHRMTTGFEGLYFAVSQPFDSREEAEGFLDSYTAALEDAGYDRENPAAIGSLKQNAYNNEEAGRYVAFDLFEEEEQTMLNLDFVVNP